MNTYRVYCPELPDKPVEELKGNSSFEVRKFYAMRHGVPVVEVVSIRLDWSTQ